MVRTAYGLTFGCILTIITLGIKLGQIINPIICRSKRHTHHREHVNQQPGQQIEINVIKQQSVNDRFARKHFIIQLEECAACAGIFYTATKRSAVAV